MDLLENPFHILGATQRDDRQRIMELAEEQGLFSDPEEITAARGVLINPRSRISAEVAWLPGVNPDHIDSLLKQLDSPHQNLLNITDLPPLASANFRTAGFLRLSNIESANLMEWILAIAHDYEKINAEEVRKTLNEERNISGFPQISDLSVITSEIQNQRRYYSQTLSSVINNLSVTERARILTLTLETIIGDSNNRCPILIDDLIQSYEDDVGEDLERKQRIIEALDENIRAMVDVNRPDSELELIVIQLIDSVKEWDAIAQPIQLSKRSRGERHIASFEIAWRVREVAFYQLNKSKKTKLPLKILSTLNEVFAEVSEVRERIDEDLRELRGYEKIEEINTQNEKLKEAADAKKPDYTLTPMVNQLIQTVKTWDPSTQPLEANEVIANTVRSIAIYFWNEHQKLEFAIKITDILLEVFTQCPEIVKHLAEDKNTLDKHVVIAKSVKKFEEIKRQIASLQKAADGFKPDYTLYEMIDQLMLSVKTWDTSISLEANCAVAREVRNIALNLWNKHQKLDFAIQITKALIELFKNANGMDEINYQLNQDLLTLLAIKEQKRRKPGCLLQIVIFVGLGIIGAFLQGC